MLFSREEVPQHVTLLVDRVVGWPVGRTVGWSVGQLVGLPRESYRFVYGLFFSFSLKCNLANAECI